MFVQFSVVRGRLLTEIIPALLAEYAVKKVTDLPYPLRTDLLFIQALLHLLGKSPGDADTLAGALFTLSALHPESNIALSRHTAPEQSPHLNPDGFTASQKRGLSTSSEVGNERNISSFLFFMLQHLMQKTGFMFNRNSDGQFQVLRWWQKALELRTNFLRAQGSHALISRPEVKLKAATSFLDLGAVDVFVQHFRPSTLVVQHPVIVSGQEGGFVQCALSYLKQAQWPRALEKAAIQGVEMLTSRTTQKSDAMRSWEAAYAVSLLCKVHLFERGQAELGPALVPLFGLSDVEVIGYWHKVLTLSDDALMNLVHERLRGSEIKLRGSHSFFEVTPTGRRTNESLPAVHLP